jgi:transcriptional regulator with XRE-family HTH domain
MLQGQRLRHMRERRALSQRALGTLSGQDGRYISKLELGILRSVTTTTLTRLVTALQVSADYLLGCSDCETLPRRSGTSTPWRRQRTTATRHRNASVSNAVVRPAPSAPPDQDALPVGAVTAVAVAPRDQRQAKKPSRSDNTGHPVSTQRRPPVR